MAAQVVSARFKVKKVLCRVYDPNRAQVFRELGIETVPTARLLSGLFSDLLLNAPVKSIAEYIGEAVEAAAGSETEDAFEIGAGASVPSQEV